MKNDDALEKILNFRVDRNCDELILNAISIQHKLLKRFYYVGIKRKGNNQKIKFLDTVGNGGLKKSSQLGDPHNVGLHKQPRQVKDELQL